MQTVNYKGFVVTLSEADTNKLDKCLWKAERHWRCTVYDKPNRKQMGFDVFGGGHATMHPLEALFIYCNEAYDYTMYDDAEELQKEFCYDTYAEAKKSWDNLKKTYYKCRKFIGNDNDILEIIEELREKWG